MSAITAKNISMSYEGKKVIDSISFSVEKGELLLIVGENGSGKTTLLKGLTGLKKIDSGILSFEENISNREIGYLPQQTEVQRDFPASVWEVVLSGTLGGMGWRPFYGKKQKDMARHAMEKLEISSLSEKCYHELSGGQQQRVLLARALCASKKILVLDEPTTALDAGASKELYALISGLKEDGMTVIMITHDVDNAVSLADKVLHLGEQKPLYFGSADEYIQNFLGR